MNKFVVLVLTFLVLLSSVVESVRVGEALRSRLAVVRRNSLKAGTSPNGAVASSGNSVVAVGGSGIVASSGSGVVAISGYSGYYPPNYLQVQNGLKAFTKRFKLSKKQQQK